MDFYKLKYRVNTSSVQSIVIENNVLDFQDPKDHERENEECSEVSQGRYLGPSRVVGVTQDCTTGGVVTNPTLPLVQE